MRQDQNSGNKNPQNLKTTNAAPAADNKASTAKANSNSGKFILRKRFGARSLAQYDENEKVTPLDGYEEVDDFANSSWDDKTMSSESEFSFDISVGSTESDDDVGISTQILSKPPKPPQRYGNQQLV
uniref:Uncharacterized protein n=1 Tax=Eucampia antarctica TaxID=49252 RepID=A0A7S2RCB0_9STRA